MVDRWKQAGKQVVLTAGRFDTLDEIQTELLRRARALGDALIVALYGEPSEPSDWQARADRLAALESVDSLTVLPEDAPVSLLQRLQPPYYVLLGEYGERDLPIVETVIAYGGFAVVLPRVSGESQG
ncbi:MAG: D-glycero-beta-D-manno-heptose 1-phosphate adenylyltransferase [Armatimonadota bacterium]